MRHSIASCQMLLRHTDWSTLHLILCIYGRRLTRLLAKHHTKIIFIFVRVQSAVQTIRLKALCGTNTAVYVAVTLKFCHIHNNLPFLSPPLVQASLYLL